MVFTNDDIHIVAFVGSALMTEVMSAFAHWQAATTSQRMHRDTHRGG